MNIASSGIKRYQQLEEESEICFPEGKDKASIESDIDFEEIEAILASRRIQLALKRCVDVVGALVLIVILSPILIGTAVLVRLSSRGPIIFRQERRGYREKMFEFLKFRSMVVDQDRVMDRHKVRDLQGSGILVKAKRDPRVTTIGAFIRRTSIDELPQLLNVLKGDMSLVGPRPLVPYMLAPYPRLQKARCMVRPGLTGLWQIRDREHNTSAKYMAEHDLEYIERIGLFLDLKILLATIPATIMGKGAY